MPRPRWIVGCSDTFNRDRVVRLLIEDDQVVLVAPPGGSAIFTAHQVHQLDKALTYARDTATGQV